MPRRIDLNGIWQYEPLAWAVLRADGTLDLRAEGLPPAGEMRLPANWERGGLENFHGRVRFRRTFEFDGLREDEQSAWLVFGGVDYFARVWLNDTLVGEHAGYFEPFSFEVTGAVRGGVNTLVVEVTSPNEEPGTVWPDRKLLIKGVLSHWDCRPGSWDHRWGQEHNSGGIWNHVWLETRPPAYLGHVRAVSRLVPRQAPPGYAIGRDLPAEGPRQAIVLVEAEVVAPPGAYDLVASAGAAPPASVRIRVERPGERHTVAVVVEEPRLWWTWDLGEPHLEPCVVRLEQAGRALFERRIEIGIREVGFDPARGEWYLNGRRFFIRGTNVVPTLWLGEYDEAMIGRDIQLLREAHINGVRVCVHVNRDEFYTACDRAGILVWQDFALQWGYAETPAFMQEAVRQIRAMVRMLVNHPCIALWCCQNESTFHNKYVLDPVLAAAAASEDGSHPIRPTSEFSEHAYPGWYYGHQRDYAALPGTPVLTEFGAQALPDVESARRIAGPGWPPDWDRLAYHDFQYDQTFHVARIPLGESLEEFVARSQEYQAGLLKYAVERYRRAKYRALGGMFQFMFMDCWPAITWSVVSYERLPKRGYEALKTAYQPVLIGCDLGRDIIITVTDRGSHPRDLVLQPWVVNDRHHAFPGCTYMATLAGPGGRLDFGPSAEFEVPADGVVERVPTVTCPLPRDLAPGVYTLALALQHGGVLLSQNHYELRVATIPP